MAYTIRLFGILFGSAVMALAVVPSTTAQMTPTDLVGQSDLIFVGTVSALGKASFSGVPA